MAIVVPIVSEFDGKGLSRAIKEFQQLETTGERAQFALKKAALPAAAAMGVLAVGIGSATAAAVEDAAAQEQLAGVLQRVTNATDEQIAANEDYISTLSRATAIADDQLRPALTSLVNVTGSLRVSQDILTQATDVAAATNTDLGTVVDALSKAYAGNMKGLQALDPSLRAVIKEGATFSDVMAILADKTGGAAAAATETAAGKMKLLKLTLDEAKESIGAAFLPVLERLVPFLQGAADFLGRNADKAAIAAIAIGGLATAVLAANAALKVYNTYVAVSTALTKAFGATSAISSIQVAGLATKMGVLAAVAGTVLLVIDTFRDKTALTDFVNLGVRALNLLIDAFEVTANAAVIAVNGINAAFNAVLPGNPFPSVPMVNLPSIPFMKAPSAPSSPSSQMRPIVPDRIADVPRIDVPTLVGGGGGGGGGGGAAGGGGGGGGGFSTGPLPLPLIDLNPDMGPGGRIRPPMGDIITINVNTVTAPTDLGETIVDALRDYNRANGPIDVVVAA